MEFHRRLITSLLLLLLVIGPGCERMQMRKARRNPPPFPNPLQIPVTDREFVWNVIVETVADYFEIAREERVRQVGNVLTQGRIDTHPLIGATIAEPWRRDSTHGFERWHSTFQSIRRRAEVRVTPTNAGYLVQVIVHKELEELDGPELTSVGGRVRRHDGSLRRPLGKELGGAVSLGWIPQGRDVSLEQEILRKLYDKMYEVVPPDPVETMHKS